MPLNAGQPVIATLALNWWSPLRMVDSGIGFAMNMSCGPLSSCAARQTTDFAVSAEKKPHGPGGIFMEEMKLASIVRNFAFIDRWWLPLIVLLCIDYGGGAAPKGELGDPRGIRQGYNADLLKKRRDQGRFVHSFIHSFSRKALDCRCMQLVRLLDTAAIVGVVAGIFVA